MKGIRFLCVGRREKWDNNISKKCGLSLITLIVSNSYHPGRDKLKRLFTVCKYAGIVQFVYSFYVFSFSFSKTSRPIIIDKLGLRSFTWMLGSARGEEEERGTTEIGSYNNIPKLF